MATPRATASPDLLPRLLIACHSFLVIILTILRFDCIRFPNSYRRASNPSHGFAGATPRDPYSRWRREFAFATTESASSLRCSLAKGALGIED